MSRWEPDAADRLERAALELFTEQGYAATTVPQIAARAGLTTRSFFRHFADKREVLFYYEREFPAVVASVIADVPDSVSPVELVLQSLEVLTAHRFNDWRTSLIARRAIVQAEGHLRERELLKLSVLGDAIRQGLLDRGIDDSTASWLAPMTVMIFDRSLNRWLDDEAGESLQKIVRDSQRTLWAALGFEETRRALRRPAVRAARPATG
jgi:AcrR family transcriptional regulator